MDHNQNEFLIEIEELIEHIFADLDELRATNEGGRARRELIDRIFRRVHSVKGSAASAGLEFVSGVAHEFENLLGEIRAGRVQIDGEVLDTCERATDMLSESLSLAASGADEPSRHALFERLQAATHAKTKEVRQSDAIPKDIPFEIWQSLTETEKQRLMNSVAERRPLFVVNTSFDLENFDAEFFRLKEKLANFGEVIATSPAVDDEHSRRINFRVLFACDSDAQAVKSAVFGLGEIAFKPIPTNEQPGSPGATGIPAEPTAVSVATLSNYVRADLDKLDGLIFKTNELWRETSTALELLARSQQASTPPHEDVERLTDNIRSRFIRLEEELINLRMVCLAPTVQRAVRAGRAAARLAGKEIEFEIGGAEIQLDKLLAETIADPLIQLVRNAVDHGIETAAERARAGKKPRGTISIEAVREGSQSWLRVTDDGRGVDPHAVAEAAVRLGITYEAQPDIERSLRLIFRPGFTTLTSASDISGRGVGLDIVETAVEQVGGELRVSTKPGSGTTFAIRLPATFGLVAVRIVVSNGYSYCIPAAQIVGISENAGTAATDQVQQVNLRNLLGQPHDLKESSQGSHLVTCEFIDERPAQNGHGKTRVGIFVDRVEESQEVLVRNLGRHAGRWYGIAGATELENGTVALVLDLPRLLSARSDV